MEAFTDAVGAAGAVEVGWRGFGEEQDFGRVVGKEPGGELRAFGHEGFGAARFGDEENVDAGVFGEQGGVAGRASGLANPV